MFFLIYNGEAIIVSGHTPLMLLKPEKDIEQQIRRLQQRPIFKAATIYDLLNEIKIWRDIKKARHVKDVKPQWRRNGKILMMDTGSYFPNGRISCVDILTNKIWQSD